jgi:hypothetical protein
MCEGCFLLFYGVRCVMDSLVGGDGERGKLAFRRAILYAQCIGNQHIWSLIVNHCRNP